MAIVSAVKSPRYLYECEGLQRVTYNTLNDGTKQRVLSDALVFLKESHANWLGSTLAIKIASNDPRLIGTRSVVRPDETSTAVDAAEQTETYRRNIGGYRSRTFTLVHKSAFVLNYSIIDDQGNSVAQTEVKKTIGIGCPSGISLHRFMVWIETLPANKLNQLSAIISPDGKKRQL